MTRYFRKYAPFLMGWVILTASVEASDDRRIVWRPWSSDIFKIAEKENKYILLDLEAVWCHWCHVMDHTTYSDPQVAQIIQDHFIPVKVDQDSRPDLSNLYQDYGWPATIILDGKKRELAKESGYIRPPLMVKLLKGIVSDPTPQASEDPNLAEAPTSPFLSQKTKDKLKKRFLDHYDHTEGGFGFSHKFLHSHSVELAIMDGFQGSRNEEKMAKESLSVQLNLLDPVWGGMYQYSTGGNWKEPHFEKIMEIQTENLRIYSLAYSTWKNPQDLKAAIAIESFLETFLLSEEGSYFTSQDADLVKGEHSGEYFVLDDRGRRKKGIPAIDRHQYARENGWVIYSLVRLFAATGEEKFLHRAEKAANWVLQNRSISGGGFRHDANDASGPFLGDTLSLGRSFLALYSVTGQSSWLKLAENSAQFIEKNFRYLNAKGERVGLVTSKSQIEGFRPTFDREENILIVRFGNLLNHYTGKKEFKDLAVSAMTYLAIPEIASERPTAGVLLADFELTHDPIHIVVVGPKNSPDTKSLAQAALKFPGEYKRTEFWDPSGDPLPREDVKYPVLKKPAAFACHGGRCSTPIFNAQDLRTRIEKSVAKSTR